MNELPLVPGTFPPGLEHLLQIDKLLIIQKLEAAEIIYGIETINRYEVTNNIGQQIYFATEKSNLCFRFICGQQRPFKVYVADNMGTEVMCFKRPLQCSCCCSPCCLQKLEVQAPIGEPIGYVIQKWHPCLPMFAIQNKNKETVLRISGPCCCCRWCCAYNFKIEALHSSEEIGKITKVWGGLVVEALTDADNFEVSFPMDLDVSIKAVLLGASILIDFMYFEKTSKQLIEVTDRNQ
ncbi:phospholipid scramblase 2-like [Pristis pectinata]|uniref:phospholipid scramblase 2-like n=1 Tax=Pristis pectinata TaxID=685728 RepID=UPI00223E0A34|nr:phospholipid scramblase 2-like [Pristis pectinata]